MVDFFFKSHTEFVLRDRIQMKIANKTNNKRQGSINQEPRKDHS